MFKVTWDRPIHIEHPDLQTDRGGQDLPECNSREDAFATMERWKPWMRANKLFNIFLHDEGPGYAILTHITLD